MKHFISISESDETSKNLIKLLQSLAKENPNIDFLNESELEDIVDLRLAKKAKKDLKKAVPFDKFLSSEKKRRKMA